MASETFTPGGREKALPLPRHVRAFVEILEARIAPAFVSGAVNLADLDGGNGFKLSGLADGDSAGHSISDAGDVNGDGFDDFLIGVPFADEGGTNRGAVYVIFGSDGGFDASLDLGNLSSSDGFKLSGIADGDRAGTAVSAAGDVNGDGLADFLIGAPLADEGGTDRGAVYVIFGSADGFVPNLSLGTLDGTNGFKLRGVIDGDQAGTAVNAAGDVNGDGFADLIVGAPFADEGGLDGGAAYVVFGKAGGFSASLTFSALNGSNGFLLRGTAPGNRTGTSASGAGDVNGDGFADLIVGAYFADEGGSNRGAAYVVFGKSGGFSAILSLDDLTGSNGFKLSGINDFDTTGRAVSGVGDVNGDGFADFVIGAPRADAGGPDRGVAYVIFGRVEGFGPTLDLLDLDGSNGFQIRGLSDGDRAGQAVSGAGDVNGDGIDDLIVGAYFADEGGSNRGAAYVVFGARNFGLDILDLNDLDGPNGFKLSGIADDDQAGRAVSAAGDVNGDGFADLLVGARGADEGGTDRGAAYLIYGGPSGFFIDPTIAANGKSATFIDVDGDLVTVKVSRGKLTAGNFLLLQPTDGVPGAQLLALTLDASFAGANVSLTAKRSGADDRREGDGLVNVGVIDATNVNLGKVTVSGDLGRIDAGAPDGLPGLKGLTVGSLGVFGGRTQDTGGLLLSEIIGRSGPVKVLGDVREAQLGVFDPGTFGRGALASLTIGGSLIGGKTVASGAIIAGATGAVKIGGDVIGGAGSFSAYLQMTKLTSLTIGGDLRGGGGDTSGSIGVIDRARQVNIGGSLIGGSGFTSGVLLSDGGFGKVSIKGDLIGGSETASGFIVTSGFGANIGSVTIGGDARSGSTYFSGGIIAGGTLGAVSIGGDVTGTAAVPFTIGGIGSFSGKKSVALASLKVGGDLERALVLGGFQDDYQPINGHAQIGAITVGGDWIASTVSAGLIPSPIAFDAFGVFGDLDDTFINDGPDGVVASIASVTIKGTARGTFEEGDRFAIVAEQIGSVTIGGAKLALTKGAGNDLAGFAVGLTPDFIVREFSRVTVATPPVFDPVPAAGPRAAQPAEIALGALDDSNGFKLSGATNTDRSGFAVSNVGDVNGDGFDDLLIGAPYATENLAGRAHVVFGRAGGFGAGVTLDSQTLDGVSGFTINGVTTGDATGISVSGAGDVNGDGFADLLIGAREADEGGTNRGAAYVIFGRASGFAPALNLSTLDGFNGFKLSGAADGDFAGRSVSGVGDLDDDGFDDIIIGASLADEGGTNRGAAYVVYGKAGGFTASLNLGTLDGSDGFKLPGLADSNLTGFAVGGAGDVNGDGFADLIVGAYGAAEGGTNRGAAYVIFGLPGGFDASEDLAALDGSNGFKLTGIADSDFAGFSVGSAGDVNGDGFADLLIGAYLADEGGTNRGAAYVIFGKADGFAASLSLGALDGSNGFKLAGLVDGDFAGRAVKAAGDVNGDGFADLIVGADGANEGGSNRGAAYVILGKAGGFAASLSPADFDGSNGFKLSGSTNNGVAGFAVGGAGDVNGDGFDDLIVGAYGAAGGGVSRGETYVVFGGPTGEFIDPTISADKKTATWTDVDGDLVTLKVSSGALTPGNFQLLAKSTADPRAQLLSLTLGATFHGADVTLTAKRAGGGDGKVNLGFLDATGVDLGKVTIGGDLGRIVVGDANPDAALKSFTAGSLGAYGGRTQDTGGTLFSEITGPAGAVKILGDVREAVLAGDALASLTIGGSLIGGKSFGSGLIAAKAGSVKIGGDVVGSAGGQSGSLGAAPGASITIGGDLRGGSGMNSGSIFTGEIGKVSIGGSQIGGSGVASGALLINGSIGKVSIKGSQIGGDGRLSGAIAATGAGANIAGVTIGGDARSGTVALSGGILANGALGPVSIAGDVIGTAAAAYTISAGGPLTGTKSLAIASLKVGGDFERALVLAGFSWEGVPFNGHAQIGTISVGRDWIASSVSAGVITSPGILSSAGIFGNGDDDFASGGPASVVASIASIVIKGHAFGTLEPGDRFAIVAEQIGSASIGGAKVASIDKASTFLGSTPDFAIREIIRV